MSDMRTILDQGLAGFTPGDGLDPTLRKARRRQLNRRAMAGALALVLAAGAFAGLARALTSQPRPAAHPLPSGRIVFSTASTSTAAPYPRGELFSVRADGSGLKRLTRTSGDEAFPVYSPDGSLIAFRGADGRLWLMNSDGTHVRRITGIRIDNGRAVWSPDGSMLAFAQMQAIDCVQNCASGAVAPDIWVVRTDGSELRQLTDCQPTDCLEDFGPVWSPDGTTIGFIRDYRPVNGNIQGRSELYLLPVGGGSLRSLFEVMGEHSCCPAWSPDGRTLLTSGRYGEGRGGLVGVDVATGRALHFPADEPGLAGADNPSWSPDGQFVVFANGNAFGGSSLYIARSNGSVVRSLVGLAPGVTLDAPSWGPEPSAADRAQLSPQQLKADFNSPTVDWPELATVGFGSGSNQVGFEPGNQSAPVGPDAFAVLSGGSFWVTDPAKSRLVHVAVDGSFDQTIEDPSLRTASDLVFEDPDLYVLISEADGVIAQVRQDGTLRPFGVTLDGRRIGIANLVASGGHLYVSPVPSDQPGLLLEVDPTTGRARSVPGYQGDAGGVTSLPPGGRDYFAIGSNGGGRDLVRTFRVSAYEGSHPVAGGFSLGNLDFWGDSMWSYVLVSGEGNGGAWVLQVDRELSQVAWEHVPGNQPGQTQFTDVRRPIAVDTDGVLYLMLVDADGVHILRRPDPAIPMPTPSPAPFRGFVPSAVWFFDALHGLAAGSLGGDDCQPTCVSVVRQTVDAGKTWTEVYRGEGAFTDLAALDERHVWGIVTRCSASRTDCHGQVFGSGDAGRTWSLLSPEDLSLLSFSTSQIGWAVANPAADGASVLERTIDGGRTWSAEPMPCPRRNPDAADVSFVSEGHGWLLCVELFGAGSEGKSVLETKDGGATWKVVAQNRDGSLPAIGQGLSGSGYASDFAFRSDGLGIMGMDRGNSIRTMDGGNSWSETPLTEQEVSGLASASFGGSVVYALLHEGQRIQEMRLVRSDDNGVTWQRVFGWPLGS